MSSETQDKKINSRKQMTFIASWAVGILDALAINCRSIKEIFKKLLFIQTKLVKDIEI